MSRNSPAASKAELYGLLWSANAPTFSVSGFSSGSVHVYDHEPRVGDMLGPIAVTVATAGMTPDFYVIALRIYADTSKVNAKKAQDDLDAFVLAVDHKISSGFGPSNWEIDWREDYDAFVATNLLEAGRED